MFENGQMAPVVLAVLMAFGVLLPLAIAVCYLMQSHKYTGDNVMQETIVNFVYSPHKIKESQSVTRMLETLVVAMEYISMPVRLTDEGCGERGLRIALSLVFLPLPSMSCAFRAAGPWRRCSSSCAST